MREKRRFGYNVVGRWAPTFFEHSKERLEHPIHPLINLEYQEAFGVGAANAIWAFQPAFSIARIRTTGIWNSTTTRIRSIHPPISTTTVPLRTSSTSTSAPSISSWSTGLPPRASLPLGRSTMWKSPPRTSTARSCLYEPDVATLDASGQPIGTTGAILPGYTTERTQVRALPASTVNISNAVQTYYAESPTVNFGGEHKVGNWDIDYKSRIYDDLHPSSVRHTGRKGANGGTLTYSSPMSAGLSIAPTPGLRPLSRPQVRASTIR